MEALLGRAEASLASGQALDATVLYGEAYAQAVGVGDQVAAARAMLGQAQGEFAARRLVPAAQHARTALDLLTPLAMPQAKHAADLIVQIDHNRYLG